MQRRAHASTTNADVTETAWAKARDVPPADTIVFAPLPTVRFRGRNAMSLRRRKFLRLAACAAALPAFARNARAQSYPARPVRIILGFPAGGSTDLVARIMAAWLSERLG